MIHGDTGDIYCGNWLNDQAHGKGSYFHADSGAIYEGDWLCDKQDGFGHERWPDGTEYQGNFKQGKKHGRGKLVLRDNEAGTTEFSVFEGDFVDNMIDGKGKINFPQSNKKLAYEGEWRQNKR